LKLEAAAACFPSNNPRTAAVRLTLNGMPSDLKAGAASTLLRLRWGLFVRIFPLMSPFIHEKSSRILKKKKNKKGKKEDPKRKEGKEGKRSHARGCATKIANGGHIMVNGGISGKAHVSSPCR